MVTGEEEAAAAEPVDVAAAAEPVDVAVETTVGGANGGHIKMVGGTVILRDIGTDGVLEMGEWFHFRLGQGQGRDLNRQQAARIVDAANKMSD